MSPKNRLAVAGAAVLLLLTAGCSARRDDLRSVFPRTAGAWTLSSEAARMYVGHDLFQLIDGGAEIYHEYGFVRVAASTYREADRRRVTAEVFEMEDDRAAYGAYSFRRGIAGKPVSVGQEGTVEDYYLHFWKGRYLVTLTALDPAAANAESLLEIARPLDQRLSGGGPRPAIVEILPREPEPPAGVKYMEGPLALSSVLDFSLPDALVFREGVAASYGAVRLVVLAQASEQERRDREPAAVAALERGVSGRDRPGERLRTTGCDRFLAVAVGPGEAALDRVLRGVREHIGGCP